MTSTPPSQSYTIDSVPDPHPQDAGKICKKCSRGWPVVLFQQRGADNVLSDTCIRCAKPHREQDLWSKRYASMARKIQRARNRMEDDHRQLQQRQTSTVNHRSSSGSSKAHRVLPPSEQPSSSKRSKKNHQHPSSIENVISPGGQDEGVSSYTTGTGGSGSGGSVSAHPVKFRKNLAHLAIRLMDEPLRAQAWLETRYTQAATSALPQKVVYEHYVSSLVQTTHLQLGPNDEADSRFITGRVMSHIPKPLMGVGLMGVLTQTFPQVTLNREGFMCVGMRMLSATEERDAEFRLVHTLMSLRAINRHPMGWIPPTSTASSGNAQSAASPPMLSGQSSTRTSSPQPHVQPPSHQIPHPSKHGHDSMMPNLKVKPTVSIPLSTTAAHFTTQIATSNATSRLDRGSENVEEDRDMYSMFSFAPLAPVDHS